MNGRITAIGFVLLLGVSLLAGTSLAGTQSTPTVSAGSTQVSSGSAASVAITLDEAPSGLQTYEIEISLENPQVAHITGAKPGIIRGNAFSVVDISNESVTIRAADFNDKVQPGAQDVSLGTVLINDTYGGTTDITVSINTLRNENNSEVNATASSGELSVSDGTPLPATTVMPTTTTAMPTTTTAPPTTTTAPPTTGTTAATAATTTETGTTAPTGDTPTPAENTIPPADGSNGGDGGSDSTPTTTTTSSSSGPGFTVGLALLAVAGTALLARRR